MNVHDRLSDVEQHALLAVWRLGEGAHGGAVRDELEDVTGRSLTISSVYVTLVRLEKHGLLTSAFTEPEQVRGGKAKRVFRIEPDGVAALKRSRQQFDRLWAGLEHTPEWRS